jgi:hypothetical protein
MDFDAIAAAKAEQQARLIAALTATPADAGGSARERLEQLLDAETVADLDQAVLALVEGESPSEEPDVLSAARDATVERRTALVEALLGRRRADGEQRVGGGLDGGARQTPSVPETHGQMLIRLLRDGQADAGRDL